METWKAIEGTGGRYEVSADGRVRSNSYLGHGRTQELALTPDRKGYLRVSVFTESGLRRRCKVHRLVATAFIPNPEQKREVNHKDGNKRNNRVENLEWATPHENALHAYRIGLKERAREQCRAMGNAWKIHLIAYNAKRAMRVCAINTQTGEKRYFDSQASAARALGVLQPNISRACRTGRNHVGVYEFVACAGGDAK